MQKQHTKIKKVLKKLGKLKLLLKNIKNIGVAGNISRCRCKITKFSARQLL